MGAPETKTSRVIIVLKYTVGQPARHAARHLLIFWTFWTGQLGPSPGRYRSPMANLHLAFLPAPPAKGGYCLTLLHELCLWPMVGWVVQSDERDKGGFDAFRVFADTYDEHAVSCEPSLYGRRNFLTYATLPNSLTSSNPPATTSRAAPMRALFAICRQCRAGIFTAVCAFLNSSKR